MIPRIVHQFCLPQKCCIRKWKAKPHPVQPFFAPAWIDEAEPLRSFGVYRAAMMHPPEHQNVASNSVASKRSQKS